MYDTDKYMYALLEKMRLMVNKNATGNICFFITVKSTGD